MTPREQIFPPSPEKKRLKTEADGGISAELREAMQELDEMIDSETTDMFPDEHEETKVG